MQEMILKHKNTHVYDLEDLKTCVYLIFIFDLCLTADSIFYNFQQVNMWKMFK